MILIILECDRITCTPYVSVKSYKLLERKSNCYMISYCKRCLVDSFTLDSILDKALRKTQTNSKFTFPI